MGTKACENEPSANSRRSRMGILKATKKASVSMPAPKTRAMMVSRTNPRMRESRVMLLTAARALSRFMDGPGFARIVRVAWLRRNSGSSGLDYKTKKPEQTQTKKKQPKKESQTLQII